MPLCAVTSGVVRAAASSPRAPSGSANSAINTEVSSLAIECSFIRKLDTSDHARANRGAHSIHLTLGARPEAEPRRVQLGCPGRILRGPLCGHLRMTGSVLATPLRTPSPRTRGEGWVEGPSPLGPELRPQNRGEAPSPSLASRARPLPAQRGEVKHVTHSRGASAPEFCRHARNNEKEEGGGAPKGACHPLSASYRQHCCYRHRHGRAPLSLLPPRCGEGGRGTLAFRRFAADSPRQSQPALAQPQAVFPGTRLLRT